MKISKLFHWLYGVVMLLPIFAIGVTCLVNTFNDSPNTNTQAEIVDVPIYYQTNDVESIADLTINNIYTWEDNYTPNQTPSANQDIFSLSYCNIIPQSNTMKLYIDTNGRIMLIYQDNGLKYKNINAVPMTFAIKEILNTTYIDSYFLSKVTRCDINVIKEYQEEEVITYVQNDIFYYAVDKVQQSPLFNWAYDSFLVAPFAYIVSLFSMPTNSFVVLLLSYWLAISIIWLVFDLVMYVPLLIHRWIDKGVLE